MLLFHFIGLFVLLVTLIEAKNEFSRHALYRERRSEGDGPEWSYSGKTGPDFWSDVDGYEDCSGDNQSPILLGDNTTAVVSKRGLQFDGYETPRTGMTLENNGKTVILKLAKNDDETPFIYFRGNKNDKYKFSALYFHFGENDTIGSEHRRGQELPGTAYPMEVQLVHKNDTGRIAVVGVFYKVKEKNKKIVPLVQKLRYVQFKGKSTKLNKKLALDAFLPPARKWYFRYFGSLTTPPCSEDVVWTVYASAEYLSKAQIKQFRKLYSTEDDSQPMYNNFRPLENRNNRTVYELKVEKKS